MKPWERFAQTPQEPAGPWTKFKPAQEELPQLSPNTDRKYTDLEKLKYTLRAAGEGAALGAGDIVAGATNVMMNDLAGVTHGQSLADRLKSYGRALWHATPMGLAGLFKTDEFKQGRKDFVREQEDFKEAHPGLNLTGELAGGLVTGIGGAGKVAGAKMLGGLGKWGTAAATGAGSGAAYGFGTGLTRDEDTLDPVQGAKEGTQGAFLGGLFGVAAPAAFGAAGRLANRLNKHNRAYRQLSKAAKGKLEESIESGVPLIDTADKKALRLIEGANLADDEASELLGTYANNRMAALQEEAQGTVDSMFGKKGFDTLLKERKEYGNKMAEPLYAKAFAKGRVNVRLDPMQQLMAQELRQNPYSAYAFRNVADNDFRFLDAVKRGLDYKISAIEEGIKKGTLKPADGVALEPLKQSRARLLQTLDKASPHYRFARSVAEQGFKFEEGAKAGQRAFLDPAADIASKVSDMGRGGRKPDWEALRQKARALKTPGAAERQLAQINMLEDIYNAAARAEHSGYKAGAGQALRKLLEGSGANWENYYQKLFNRNRLNKLQAMGIDTRKFMPEIEKGKKTAQNMRNLFRGSQTAEREQDKAFFKPVEFLKKKAAEMISKAWVISPQDIARMSIDPGYAALMRQAARQLPKTAYTDISGAGGVFANIFGPLTKRETGIMREEIKKHLKENVRNTSVPNNYVNGGKIKFNKAGLDKAVSSASTAEKLKLLQHLPELSERANPLPISYSDKNIRTFIAPVKKDGVKTEAALTIEQHKNMPAFFHNINPIGYFAKRYEELKKDPFMRSGIQIRSKGATNSIADKTGKIKGKKNNYRSMKDLLILLQRPWTLGLQGNIARENTEDK